MRIGIDARMYGPQNSGLGRYVEQLINHLLKIDSENEYVLFCLKNNTPKLKIENCKLKIITTCISWYSWQEQILYSSIINKEKVNLMHFPHWNVPLFYDKPFVITVHDLIMYHYPRVEASTHGPLIYWLKDKMHRLVINHAVKKAKRVIVPCEFTKQDVAKTLGVDANKIDVTYLAPFEARYIIHNTKYKNDSHSSAAPYILYVGNAYPHKNLAKLIDAWQIFCQKYSNRYELVLVGKKSYFFKQLFNNRTMEQLNNVRYLGYRNDNELIEIYQQASLYIFPSLYEGFGLPPLEAMQYNIPIVSSNSSCLPEILEDAVIYFDPNNLEEMVRAIHLGLNDSNLRSKLTAKGQMLLQKYSWEKTAKQTLEIYKQASIE